MPKTKSYISDEILLTKLNELAPQIQITPNQVSMLLGISLETLQYNRSYGHPPPAVKEGGVWRYRVGDVRDYLNSKKLYHNTAEAYRDKLKEQQKL